VQKVKDEEGEGCNIHGSLEVNKVAGNFHFATGQSFLQSAIFLADLLALQDNHYNVRMNNRISNISYFIYV
jgi:endoplasmic reticulum-Golgi intermediate compartment protein 3